MTGTKSTTMLVPYHLRMFLDFICKLLMHMV